MFKQNQIASAIIIAGLAVAGAILLKGSTQNRPIDPQKAEVKLTKSMPIFSACLDSRKYEQAVKDSTENGTKAGVNGTPKGFILKGDKLIATIDGAQPANTTIEKIEKALSDKNLTSIPNKLLPVSGSDYIRGDVNAPITVLVYVDYQCPFCGKFFKDTEQEALTTYINSGKIRLVARDFAFLGEESMKAAEAVKCAGDQGKFWEYYDYLFTHQSGENENAFSNLNLKNFAKELKLK